MSLNLLRDPWIPVRRANGLLDTVAPHQIVPANGESAPVSFAARRPDFDGALAQFMIGLLQTARPPASDDDWADDWEVPPAPEVLAAAFAPFERAFNVDGPGPRFLQDADAALDGPRRAAAELLVETPTGKTLQDNTALFVKNQSHVHFPLADASLALLSLQLNAPSGGQGHRTSIRGGGPLTTLLWTDPARTPDAPLWRSLWLNVQSAEAFEPVGAPLDALFPWLRPTRTSEKGSPTPTTRPVDVHPLHSFWAIPRRIRLDVETGPDGPLVRTFVMKNNGTNYEGPWVHPLSPYRYEDTQPIALKGHPRGLGYTDWLGAAIGRSGEQAVLPAASVRAGLERSARLTLNEVEGLGALRLWVFGFDTDNMTVRSWQSATFPCYPIPPARAERLAEFAERMTGRATGAGFSLKMALKRALYGTPSLGRKGVDWDFPFHVDKDTSLFSKALFTGAEARFRENTQDAFFAAIETAVDAATDVPAEDAARLGEAGDAWVAHVRAVALACFDSLATPALQHRLNPAAVSAARSQLSSALRAHG